MQRVAALACGEFRVLAFVLVRRDLRAVVRDDRSERLAGMLLVLFEKVVSSRSCREGSKDRRRFSNCVDDKMGLG